MTTHFRQYELHEVLNTSANGKVYRATHKELHQPVALKLFDLSPNLDDFFLGRVLQDMSTLNAYPHPNVLNVYDFDCSKEYRQAWMITEIVSSDLAKYLAQFSGRLPWRNAIKMAYSIATGLKHCHDLGVIHLDIKPSNILVDADGNPKIADFGSSLLLNRSLTQDTDFVPLNQTRWIPNYDWSVSSSLSPRELTGWHMPGIGGTPAYMSPEQWKGSEVNHLSDQYSLGITLFEMLTGDRPYFGDSLVQIANAHQFEDLPEIDKSLDIPGRLEELIRKSTAKSPGQRYQNIGDFAEDLRVLLDDGPRNELRLSNTIFSQSEAFSRVSLTTLYGVPELEEEDQTMIGSFKLQVHSHKGGFGNVFLSKQMRDQLDGKKIATRDAVVKTLYPGIESQEGESYDQLLDSYVNDLLAMEVNDPNCVTVYDAGIIKDQGASEYLRSRIRCSSRTTPGQFASHPLDECGKDGDSSVPLFWIAYEFASEGSLQDIVNRSEFEFEIPVVTDLISQIINGVIYLHKKRIVHRDLKPSNLLNFPENKLWKVSDFGASAVVNEDGYAGTSSTYVTQSGGWSAPEQRLGWPVTFAADVWSLGQIMFYLLTERYAFLEWPGRVPPAPTEINQLVPLAVSDVVLKCLRTESTGRYENASDLSCALKDAGLVS